MEEGLLTDEELDDKTRRILGAILAYGIEVNDDETEERPLLDTPENRAVALEVAEESIVLLKNENGLLPSDKGALRKLLVVGPNASEACLGGGGSASVTPFYSISPLQGIREICDAEVEVNFIEGCSLVGAMDIIRDHAIHEEGLFVGYRHSDAAGIEPHYPFGCGLGYTTFEIGKPMASGLHKLMPLARLFCCKMWNKMGSLWRVMNFNLTKIPGKSIPI